MAKRKSITGIKKKRPSKASVAKRPAPPRSETPQDRAESVTWEPHSPLAGKRTLLSIQDSRRKLQQNRVNKTNRARSQGPLKSILKNVSQNVIQSKWSVLDKPAQEKVEELFQSIELPVLAKYTNEASKIEAQNAISFVMKALCKRIPKMPFPSTTKAEHFDYGGLSKKNRELQQKLRKTAESIASFKAEVEKQKTRLQAERQELQELESAIQKQEDQYSFLPPLDETFKRDDMPDAIGLAGG